MKYYNQADFDNGNLIDTNSIEIKRNTYNMPVLLIYTHNDDFLKLQCVKMVILLFQRIAIL